jgi:hypothetical protein
MTRRLAAAVVRVSARLVDRLPPPRRAWGEAVLAEWSALPPEAQRLSWALGGLWFILKNRRSEMPQPVAVWLVRVVAILGVVSVAPLAYAQVLVLRDDAPDATFRSSVVMLAAQMLVAVAFLASLRRWPLRAVTLVVAILVYAGAAAFAGWDNGGWPVLAAIVFPAAPALLVTPIVVIDLTTRRHSEPATS